MAAVATPLEDVYSVADAVVLGNLLITLLKNQDRVGLKELPGAESEGRLLTVTLPPVSWSALVLG